MTQRKGLQRSPVQAAAFWAFLMPFLVALGGDSAWSQQDGALRIAVIDTQRILREAASVVDLSRRVEALRQGFSAELQAREAEFRESDLALARERSDLSAETYAKKRRELEQRATDLQRQFDERRKNLDRIFRQGMGRIQETVAEISREIAEERNLDLLLAKVTIVLVRPSLEVTDEAIKRLNQRLPKVDLPELQK